MTTIEQLMAQPLAHRGLHDTRLPENSLGAFEAAASAGYGIELDVHLTADGVVVVHHDASTERLTGEQLSIKTSRAADLTALRLQATSYRIPTLAQVLVVVGGRVPLLIELKSGYDSAALGQALQAGLADYQGAYAVQSFDPRYLRWYAHHASQVCRGQLAAGFALERDMRRLQRFVLRTMLLNALTRPHFIAYAVDDVDCRAVRWWRRWFKLPLLVWTVRTPRQAAIAKRLRAGIIFEGFRP